MRSAAAAPQLNPMPLDRKVLMTPESVTAIAAIVVAVAALGVSIWEGRVSRQHNRLSVKPAPCFIWRDHPGHPLGLYLKNMGLGPAFVDRLATSLDSDAVTADLVEGAFDMCDKLGLQDVRAAWSPEPREVIAADMEIPVVVFEDTMSDESKRRQQVLLLQRAEFRLSYASLYGDAFTLVYRIASKKHPL